MVKRMVRWLMHGAEERALETTRRRTPGSWSRSSTTTGSYESEVPDFVGTVTLGSDALTRETFQGRSTEAKVQRRADRSPDPRRAGPGRCRLVFTKERPGHVFYMLRLRYAADVMLHEPLDQGFLSSARTRCRTARARSTSFKAGDLIEVTLRIRNTKERRFVAVTDPIPAGTEPVESWFATTATALAEASKSGIETD